jgi:hypothetical protein
MRSKLPVDIHPVADLFPLMSDEEFAGLKDDIDTNGVREPMTMWQSKLIDGRNRLAACVELGIDWEGHLQELDTDTDPVAWAISHNLHRRHLSTSQRAMVAARIRDIYDEQAKERKKETEGRPKNGENKPVEILPPVSKARDAAGSAVNVSGKLVDAATTVLEQGSKELIAKVDSGEVTVSKAAKIAKTVDKKQQVKAAEKPSQKITKKPELKPERGVFGELRELFDSMTIGERKQAALMWADWIAEVA